MSDQPSAAPKRAAMKPIWYFVGWLLLVTGAIVMLTGIWEIFRPPANAERIQLFHLHTGSWWGFVITAAGALFVWANRNAVVE